MRSSRTESDEMDLDSLERGWGHQTNQAYAVGDVSHSSQGRMAPGEEGGQGPSPLNKPEQVENPSQLPVVAEEIHPQLSPTL